MGLDGVELVMEVEDRFGITISNDAASRIQTVGDLIAVVEAATAAASSGRCWSARTFYRLREALDRVRGTGQLRVRPGDGLEDALPREGRQRAWRDLARVSGYQLPALVRPGWVVAAIGGIAVSVLALGAWRGWDGHVALWIGGVVVIVVVMRAATAPMATRAPEQDFRGLVSAVMARNRVEGSGGLAAADVWEIVRRIVAEQFGVAEERVTRETRFIEDLGMG